MSVGLSVSVVGFTEQSITIAPPNANDFAALFAEPDTAKRLVKFDSLTTIGGLEASRQGYDIAPAAHVGLFDGALSIAYGTALRAGQSRRFWAVGFSFMGLTEQGAKLVSNLSK